MAKQIHVRNLEKYQDGYKDRRHYWAKIYLDMIQSNPESEMLCEVDFSRLVKLIVLESCTQHYQPANETYLARKGFDFGVKSLSESLKDLSHFIEIVDVTENEETVTKPLPREEKSREEKSREERVKIPSPSEFFELYKNTVRNLPQPRELTTDRERKVRLRLRERALSEWKQIFERMDATPFLLGTNQRGWQASFDWIIANETNAAKVLEGKYDNRETDDDRNRKILAKLSE